MNAPVAIAPQEAVTLGAQSLDAYGKLFFPRTVRQETPDFHLEIDKALYSPARYNAFKIFRGGAKTSKLRIYTSQRIAYAISRCIMYVSVSQPHAMMSCRWLRRQVQYNRNWTNTFGLEKGDKWTDEWLEVRHHLHEDPTMPGIPVIITLLAMGITGQIRGFNPDDFRPDLIILDDVLNDENTATEEQKKKINNLIFGALLNSLEERSAAPLAKAVFLQTPLAKGDAIDLCMKDPLWNPLSFGVFDETGRSRWEARLPTAELLVEKEAHIRRSQYRLWMREKECMLVSGEDKALDTSKWRTYDTLPEFLDTVISLDPASADPQVNRSKRADDFAIAAIGFRGADVFVLDYFAEKAVMPDLASNRTFDLLLLYNPRRIIVESTAYQRIMAWFLEQEMIRRRLFCAVDQLQVGRKSNADRIMQTIPGLAAFGHFWIRPGMLKLIQQADDYDPADKSCPDDILTAIANGIISWNPMLRQNIAGAPAPGNPLDESQYKRISLRGAP